MRVFYFTHAISVCVLRSLCFEGMFGIDRGVFHTRPEFVGWVLKAKKLLALLAYIKLDFSVKKLIIILK